jgi:asparagine synthase (glutamine-hydrolysing)
MWSSDGNLAIIFNGEIYNYLELRAELSGYPFQSRTDTEVILAAYQRWGEACLDRFHGMFAFVIWNQRERSMFAARDRFGVKPLHYAQRNGAVYLASEIRALHAAGIPAEMNDAAFASYLTAGLHDHCSQTFWNHIEALPAGHKLTLTEGRMHVACWYDLASATGTDLDQRPAEVVEEEYRALLLDSVRLRFRSDVPVGINLSGGLDSSTLLGLVQAVDGEASQLGAFTYITGDPAYDELPWVQQMLAHTRHPSIVCRLTPEETRCLAESIQRHESEPFGGLPTIAYGKLFETIRAAGVVVVMDGQGMDEQWAGYDYYEALSNGSSGTAPVQGTKQRTVRPECLTPEFRALAVPFDPPHPFPDKLRNRQYWDARYTKIPRALRFNDRVSMRCSVELREPFLDHRLFELALRQPADRKIVNGTRKWMLRRIARQLLPNEIVEAPKRPLQTPQREWLRGPLMPWANDMIEAALARWSGSWLDEPMVRSEWQHYREGRTDNSFFVWQWISLGLMIQ